PQSDRLVEAAAGEELPVGAVGDRGDHVGVARQRFHLGARRHVPHADDVVLAAAGEALAVRAEGDRADTVGVAGEGLHRLAAARGEPAMGDRPGPRPGEAVVAAPGDGAGVAARVAVAVAGAGVAATVGVAAGATVAVGAAVGVTASTAGDACGLAVAAPPPHAASRSASASTGRLLGRQRHGIKHPPSTLRTRGARPGRVAPAVAGRATGSRAKDTMRRATPWSPCGASGPTMGGAWRGRRRAAPSLYVARRAGGFARWRPTPRARGASTGSWAGGPGRGRPARRAHGALPTILRRAGP